MSIASIELPSDCIESTANQVASRYKTIAAGWFFADGMFTIGGFAMIADEGQSVSVVAPLLLWLALFAWLGVRFLRKAERARQAGLAAKDPSKKWYLNDRVIVAATATGTPLPELAFSITPKLRSVLVAVPRAQLRSE